MNVSSRTGKAALVAFCGTLAVAGGYFAFGPGQAINAVQQYFIPAPQRAFGKNGIRVLLVGLDYDYNSKDEETSKQSRSDIIMATDLDFVGHRISELSVPRDMVATMPDGKLAKINQAQSDGGIRESQAVIAQWLGIPSFDRYVVLRIDTAKDLINALGGVDIDVKDSDALRGVGPNGPIDYDDHWGHLSIHFKPGLQHLNGDQAVAYTRFRHDWCSDPCRIMRQQQMIHAVADKVEHDRFNTLAHAQTLLAVMRKDVDTNLTTQEELSLVTAFAHVSPKDIVTAQVPYLSDIDLPNYGDSIVPDEAAKRHLVASLLNPPDDVAGTTSAVVAPSSIRIRVENGTSVSGLAARVASDLRRRGFTIADVRNAPRNDFAVTEIHSDPGKAQASFLVREALGKNATAARILSLRSFGGDEASDVTVVLGRDIIGLKP